VVLISAAVAALVGSGCGEGEREKYRDGLNDASETFVEELNAGLQTMRQRRSPKQYATGATRLQKATDRFRDDVEALETPSGADDEEKALVAALDEFGVSVGKISAAVQAKDAKATAAEGSRLNKEAGDVDRGIATLKEAVE
jgi:hypothetical protein